MFHYDISVQYGFGRRNTIEDLTLSISRGMTHATMEEWYLCCSTGLKWKTRRRLLTPTFHFSILNSFVEVMAKQAKILVDRLRPMADENMCFDIFSYIGRAALDVICGKKPL